MPLIFLSTFAVQRFCGIRRTFKNVQLVGNMAQPELGYGEIMAAIPVLPIVCALQLTLSGCILLKKLHEVNKRTIVGLYS